MNNGESPAGDRALASEAPKTGLQPSAVDRFREAETLCEACGRPMRSGSYVVDEDGVAACIPVMTDGAGDGICEDAQ